MSKLIRKIFPSAVRSVDTERKIVETVMSDETLDRYDEVIQVSAYKKTLKSFMKHPVLLSSHDYGDLRSQIGEWIKVWIDGKQLVGRAKYYYGEGNPEADWGFKLAERGIAAYSVGFIDIDSESISWEEYLKAKEEGKKVARRTYKEVELLETSQVVVPANPAALQRSLEDESDMYHDLAVKMKSKFVDHELEELLKGSSEIATRFMIQVHLPEVIDHTDDEIVESKSVEEAVETQTDVVVEKTDVVVEQVDKSVPDTEEENEEVQMTKEQIVQLMTEALEPVRAELKTAIDALHTDIMKAVDEVVTGMNLRTVLPEGTYIEGTVETFAESKEEETAEAKAAADSTDSDLEEIMKSLDNLDVKLK